MNFLYDNWIWLLTAAASGGALLWPLLGKGGGADAVTPAETVQMINREKAVVIDVCEGDEFSAGHVVGARSVPLATLDGSKSLPANKTLPVVLVCASGARARKAAATVRKLGHQRVHVLQGGMAGWREAGLPVEKSA